ncbi:MAG: class I SAM-dependent methyltransferase [Proteobacteria bacterium]|nr:class I SAM-dependent methyltransferase [Pseudomonadota bacterium]
MERTQTYLTKTIKEVDGLPCSHPASVNIDVANFYYSLTKMVRPLLVVEIGCFIGFSTLHFAQALREQGFGKMISIDAFDWEVDAGNGLENRQDVALRYWRRAQLEDIVTYVKGYSTEVYPQLESEIKKKIDLLYIDGDHSINGVFKDFNVYYGDVRVGGYIILHDIYPSMCGEYGPRVLIDHLKSRRLIPNKLELIEMQTRDGFGIAVLRKIKAAPLRVHVPVTGISKSFVKRVLAKLKGKYRHLRRRNLIKDQIIIQIIVLDASTKKPIPGVLLVCPQRWDEKRITDETGSVWLDHYLPNRYLWNVSTEGYHEVIDVLLDVESNKSPQQFIIMLEAK